MFLVDQSKNSATEFHFKEKGASLVLCSNVANEKNKKTYCIAIQIQRTVWLLFESMWPMFDSISLHNLQVAI